MAVEPAAATDICVICLEGGAVSRCHHYPGCACRECCLHDPCFQAYGVNKPCPVCRLPPQQQQPDTVLEVSSEPTWLLTSRSSLRKTGTFVGTFWCWCLATILTWSASMESDPIQLAFCILNAFLYVSEGLIAVHPRLSFSRCCGGAICHYCVFHGVLLLLTCLYTLAHPYPHSEPLHWATVLMLAQLCLGSVIVAGVVCVLCMANSME